MLNKVLQLKRTLITLDLETTGLNPEVDKIIQIAIGFHYVEKDPIWWSTFVNPGIPISNTTHHKITDEDVIGKPTFEELAPALLPKITNVDILGYHVTFDINFIKGEAKRANTPWEWVGSIIDPLHIYRHHRGHTLSNAYREYVNPDGFQGAHDASNDIKATEQVLIGQLNKHKDLPRTVEELAAFCFPRQENIVDDEGKFVWVGNDAGFNFGKWRGKLLKDPSVRSYLGWMANVGNFSDEIKDICREALDGNFPVKG